MLKSLRLLFGLLILLSGREVHAHVGSPNIFYEGKAAGVPVRIIIKPPGVIPGMAEITVRAESGGIEKVTVLPVFWETGKKGSPTPDTVKPVRGETNLYSTSLWFMKPGAYSVHVGIETAQGKGELVVPVNSLATVRNPMPQGLGVALCVLGVVLFFSFIAIIGAAATESTQAPGETMSPIIKQRRLAWTIGAAVFLIAAIIGGKRWWAAEDSDYRTKRISREWPAKGEIVVENERPLLKFSFDIPDGQKREWSPLILDHGKWSHWFLVRDGAADVFVHLHPYKLGERKFGAILPPLPAGNYHLYADISLENGLYRTLQTSVKVPAAPEAWTKRWTRAMPNSKDPLCGTAMVTRDKIGSRQELDADDAWHVESEKPSVTAQEAPLMNGLKLVWDRPKSLLVNQDTSLRFHLLDKEGKPAKLGSYLGMSGHMVVRHEDGGVFVHVHPVGNISMASQAILTARSEQPKAKLYELLASASNYAPPAQATEAESEVSFPYAFPRAGNYRVWVQCKYEGQVLTASYLVSVAER